jgi:hypothetical protein
MCLGVNLGRKKKGLLDSGVAFSVYGCFWDMLQI